MATTGKVNKKTVRKMGVSVKRALCTPYNIAWPRVQPDVEKNLLDLLAKCLTTYNLKKPVVSKHLTKEEKKEALEEGWKLVSEEHKNLRSQLIIGMTSVTRALERGRLRLVVVERGSPPMLHRHLVQLSAVRECPAVCLTGVSQHLAPLLSLSAFVAIGFKQREQADQDGFDDLVGEVSKLAPKIDLPWLSFEKTLLESCDTESLTTAEPAKQDDYESNVDEDYSYLYIYKSDKTADAANALPASSETYIGLADSSSDESDGNTEQWTRVDARQRGRRGKRRIDGIDDTATSDTGVSWYRTATVNEVYPNTKRKRFDGKNNHMQYR